MRNTCLWLVLVVLCCVAGAVGQELSAGRSPTPPPARTSSGLPGVARTLLPASATPSPSATPPLPAATAPTWQVILQPQGPWYVGDRLSMEVIPPDPDGPSSRRVEVFAAGNSLGSAALAKVGIGERLQATLLWAWDTSLLSAGPYTLTFTVDPLGPTWTQTVTLQAAAVLPAAEVQAHWQSASSRCCTFYYISGTAAERDLVTLMDMADAQAEDAARRLGTDFVQPIPIVLSPRLLGHGGFTSQEITLAYLDRNYAGSTTAMVLHHEMIHLLDNRLGGDYRPAMLAEGLAVYLSGGHFKPEVLLPRAAALLEPLPDCRSVMPASPEQAEAWCSLGLYQPLSRLADDFYTAQHEIGYLEAAALIEYMVNTWGWSAFSAFYRDIHWIPGTSPSSAIEAALQAHFYLSLSELETRFQNALRRVRLTAELVNDVSWTVAFYDMVRSYQQILDPSAYFAQAWLPDTRLMRQRQMVADLLRHPQAPENLALETLLAAADRSLRSDDFPGVARYVQAVRQVLADYPVSGTQAFQQSALACAALEIMRIVQADGYQPQVLYLDDNTARVQATRVGAELTELTLFRIGGHWWLGEQARHGQDQIRPLKRSKGGLQYRLNWSKATRPAIRTQPTTSRQPQPT